MFVFDWKFRILCPIKGKKDIDYNQIVSYLNTYSMDYVNNNYDQTSEGMTVEEVISSINYCVNYLLVKMVENNEKYFIYFTNVFSTEENFGSPHDNPFAFGVSVALFIGAFYFTKVKKTMCLRAF